MNKYEYISIQFPQNLDLNKIGFYNVDISQSDDVKRVLETDYGKELGEGYAQLKIKDKELKLLLLFFNRLYKDHRSDFKTFQGPFKALIYPCREIQGFKTFICSQQISNRVMDRHAISIDPSGAGGLVFEVTKKSNLIEIVCWNIKMDLVELDDLFYKLYNTIGKQSSLFWLLEILKKEEEFILFFDSLNNLMSEDLSNFGAIFQSFIEKYAEYLVTYHIPLTLKGKNKKQMFMGYLYDVMGGSSKRKPKKVISEHLQKITKKKHKDLGSYCNILLEMPQANNEIPDFFSKEDKDFFKVIGYSFHVLRLYRNYIHLPEEFEVNMNRVRIMIILFGNIIQEVINKSKRALST